MKRQFATYAILVVALLVGAAGCSESTRPAEESSVVLSLKTETANDEGEDYVVAVIRVDNLGSKTIEYGPGCGFLIGLTVEDVDGNLLELWDPTLVPICPPVRHTLSSGEHLSDEWSLRWAWDEEGAQYRIPAGSYTVRTVFRYSDGTEDGARRLEKVLQVELK